jgi:ABC-type branched-subunit amino acid transport system substrate-binding protein
VRSRHHAIAVMLTFALVLASAACTRSDSETESGPGAGASGEQPSEGGGGGGGSGLDAGGFGDLEGVCGEAEAGAEGGGGGAQETGLTAEQINLGTITDKGSTERPGLTKEMYDTAVAFANWCNEHGGIQGREVVINDRDAALFDFGQKIAEACQQDFALVGGGGVFDSQGIQDRIDCGLPNFPGYVVTPQASVADNQVQAIPNPVYEAQAAGYRWLREAAPDADKFGLLWVNLDGPSTVRRQVVETVGQLGYDVVYDEQYRPLGETGWRGFVQQMKDAGVEVVELIGEPEYMNQFQSAMQTEGWYPDYTILQPNYIDQSFLEEGAATLSESTYARSPFPPFDMAGDVPALQDFLDLMEQYNPEGRVAFLGVQALSSLLLFASAANECGAELSRQCVVERARQIQDWTAGGLHAPQTPGNTTAGQCSLMVHFTPDGFEQDEDMAPPTDGVYNCDPANVAQMEGDFGVTRPEA